jgi:hypothetical protein
LKKILATVLLASSMLLGLAANATPANAQIYVRVGPPAPRIEHPRVRPGYVWVNGYHRWNGRAYAWTPGYYQPVARPHGVYVQGHWRHAPQGWVWVAGHWR